MLLHWFLKARYPYRPTRMAPPTDPPIAPVDSNTPHEHHHHPLHYPPHSPPDIPCTTAIPLVYSIFKHRRALLPAQHSPDPGRSITDVLAQVQACRVAQSCVLKIMYSTSNTNESAPFQRLSLVGENEPFSIAFIALVVCETPNR